MSKIDKLDFAILDALLNEFDATAKLKAVTRKTITTQIDINKKTLYTRLRKLMKLGYIINGIVEDREHTYYIIEPGIEVLEEAMTK